MKSRIDLAKYFKEKGFKLGAEIGVADGRYSEILCKENPDLKLICIDPWAPYDKSWRTQGTQDKAFNEAVEKLKSYNATVIRKTSVEASLDVNDGSLDFVFIDGSHIFDHVMTDIIIWTRKVKKGGVLCGHDYMPGREGRKGEVASALIDAIGKPDKVFDDSSWVVQYKGGERI